MAFPLDWLAEELETLDRLELRRHLKVRTQPQGATIDWEGESLVNFGSNDYLGLAADPRLANAATEVLQATGLGAGASPLITGRGVWHARLEQQLAEWEGTEAALLFSSGFAANSSVIAALADRGDIVFSDSKNHASIIDGTRLSRATVRVYPHADMDYLAKLLSQSGTFRRRLIVTDSLFSMDGDIAPLPELVRLAHDHNAMLMVDEAHATGVFGAQGRGLCEQFGVEDEVPIRVGTLSKALGGHGGFVVGSRNLIDWLTNRARGYVFSTAAPEPICAAMLAALEIVRNEPTRRTALLESAQQLRADLRAQGWFLGESTSQIIPILLGSPATCLRFSAWLRERGFLVPGIRPPTVPEGESLLRISLCHGHTPAIRDDLLAALAVARETIATP
ncbi:MAG: 8-amino-7-oxononanoate synthase [Pirellulaceae bacterium]